MIYSATDTVKATFDTKSRWTNLAFPLGNIAFNYGSFNYQETDGPIFTNATRTMPDGSTERLDLSGMSGGFGTETWTGAVSGTVSSSSNMQGFLGTLTVAGAAIEYTYPMGNLPTPSTAGDAQYDYGIRHTALNNIVLGRTKTYLDYLQQGYGSLITDSLVVNGRPTYLQRLTYHPDGRIATKTETISLLGTVPEVTQWLYRYSNGRLVGVDKNGTNVASYGWDGNGNRSGTLVDAQDRFVSGLGSSWTYDAVGQLKTRTDSRGAWTFSYDALWSLVKVTGPQAISQLLRNIND